MPGPIILLSKAPAVAPEQALKKMQAGLKKIQTDPGRPGKARNGAEFHKVSAGCRQGRHAKPAQGGSSGPGKLSPDMFHKFQWHGWAMKDIFHGQLRQATKTSCPSAIAAFRAIKRSLDDALTDNYQIGDRP